MNIRDLINSKSNRQRSDKWLSFINDPSFIDGHEKSRVEGEKRPFRTEIINFLLSSFNSDTNYLEIGVRNPNDNFNKINASIKYSVDPGVEFEENPVDFQMTSDDFFKKISEGEILNRNIKFDVIFIDGLHLAEQVDRDIINSLNYLKEDGFIVLHDCNPPTQWHARELYSYIFTPAGPAWNGTTWKAFLKWRSNPSVFSCCIDTDWGVGVLSKKTDIGKSIEIDNPFFEFAKFAENRKDFLNLVDFNTFKNLFTDTESIS